MPQEPASTAEITYTVMITATVRTPVSRAALGLLPTASTYLPSRVLRSTNTLTMTMKMKNTI